jgi:hypothetical protein
MKTIFAFLFVGMLAVEAAGVAMTIEEYLTRTPEQKLAVLRGKPERILADASQLLRLYAVSLRDPSEEVRKVATRSSIFLMMGLQEAIPAGKAPRFPERDSNDLQMALIESLNDEVKAIRGAALNSLAFSAPPTPELEKLLLSTIKAEKDDEIAGGMIEAVAQAGYGTEQFVSEVSRLFERTTVSRAAYSAGKVLGHLKPESTLDLLISLASKPTQAQRHAIQALGAYGAKAAKAKSALEALMKDQAAPEDIRNLARISLETINTDKPQPSSLQMMKLTALWPLALGSSPNDAPKQTAPVVNPPPSVQSPAPKQAPEAKPTAPTPSEEPTSSTPWSIIVVLIVAATGLLWLLVKNRK